MSSPTPSMSYSGRASASLSFRSSSSGRSSAVRVLSPVRYLATITVTRLLDGQTTYITFSYGGAFTAGVKAASMLMSDKFSRLSVMEVEEGLADGWIRLDSLRARLACGDGEGRLNTAGPVIPAVRPVERSELMEIAPVGKIVPLDESVGEGQK